MLQRLGVRKTKLQSRRRAIKVARRRKLISRLIIKAKKRPSDAVRAFVSKPQQQAVRLFRRAHRESLISLSYYAKTSLFGRVRRLRRTQRTFSFLRLRKAREAKQKGRKGKGWFAEGLKKKLLGPDNPFKVIRTAALLDTTRGSGQHLRKSVTSYVTSRYKDINNIRFFYNYNELLPGLHPIQRLVGLFMRKGAKQRAYANAFSAFAVFKSAVRGFLPNARALLRKRPATMQAPLLVYLLQLTLQKVRPPFRSTSRKVAATKVKIPTVNNINKSYSLFFRDLKEQLQLTAEAARKKSVGKGARLGLVAAGAQEAGRLLGDAFRGRGSLVKRREDSCKEAGTNRSNLRPRRRG